ncbi:uncharacterized protein ASPGLDRAFT_46980 [Aspergillus glaucus CBS 516.65]|uniref:Uncharacterized protein n=1 Tax=Aspergillus glaucus CBS 516.65 TaxID=1160497 RepID=A0A1L9VJU3_ASPGL|nr:hypothetical protein ASPGLDRAFT_46980 [Aspergillus glaucus CBS 516.65]OJJ84163.1 hypothetical protein ASPGLDRAFT_46980 [Aspergillus glaucus CBS 516.65]
MSTPTLINLPPPPPSGSVTPSDMGPGTPNSGTTSLSTLSTTAIKDGHQGHPHPHGRHAHHSSSTSLSSTNTLEAERADRISRLAGLERVATARASPTSQPGGSGLATQIIPGYFDSQYNNSKERSTVGSASATTASVGGRTTWASGSDFTFDGDKMSEDPDDGASSVGNISDEGNASLVGFGEGASTVSGPISRPNLNRVSSGRRTPSSLGSPTTASRANTIAAYLQGQADSPMMPSPLSPAGSSSNMPEQTGEDARMIDGMTYDADVVDTTVKTPRLATPYNGEGS